MWYAIIKFVAVAKKDCYILGMVIIRDYQSEHFLSISLGKKVFFLSMFYVFSVCSDLSIRFHIYRIYSIYITTVYLGICNFILTL